jgi:hypothetical protein
MQSLNRDSQLFKMYEMFAKTKVIIVLDLSCTQDMSLFRTQTVRLECTSVGTLTESIT